MRALQLTQWKHEPELLEVPDPEPGPGQVVVRIGGAGVCHSDLHLLHEFEPGMLPFDPPFTLGHENAGWVESLGAGVHGLEEGQPVAVYGPWGCGRCHRCRQGSENYCEHQTELAAMGGGLGFDGGMAPLMLVPDARLLVPLDGLDPVEAAPLTDAALTPYHAVKRSVGKLPPGSSAVVIGCGGLGHMAVQFLETMTAATVIAVDRSAEALQLAKDSGAHVTVDAGENAAAEVLDATGGRGADVIIDIVGSDETLALATAVSRSLADVALVGLAGGSHTFGFFTSPYEVSFASTYWGSITELMEVISLAAAGRIRVHSTRYAFDDILDAYDDLAAGRIVGRGVVVP